MAPVTGGVAHGNEYGQAPLTRLGEGLLTPLPPVDRIIGMLLEVGGCRQGEAVGHALSLPEQ